MNLAELLNKKLQQERYNRPFTQFGSLIDRGNIDKIQSVGRPVRSGPKPVYKIFTPEIVNKYFQQNIAGDHIYVAIDYCGDESCGSLEINLTFNKTLIGVIDWLYANYKCVEIETSSFDKKAKIVRTKRKIKKQNLLLEYHTDEWFNPTFILSERITEDCSCSDNYRENVQIRTLPLGK